MDFGTTILFTSVTSNYGSTLSLLFLHFCIYTERVIISIEFCHLEAYQFENIQTISNNILSYPATIEKYSNRAVI